MAPARLKSSFIYLANSVNDLRGNWTVLTIVLAPLVLASALCLVPNAINIQNRLVSTFEPGTQSVVYHQTQRVQEPYVPDKEEQPDKFPAWLIQILYGLSLIIVEAAVLVTLCMLWRVHVGQRAPTDFAESIAILEQSVELAPAFFWVSFLKLTPILMLWLVGKIEILNPTPAFIVLIYLTFMTMLVGAGIAYLWLYFAQFALVFGGRHSFHALLLSRDLMRKRFFKVSMRIVVFLIVWWGYSSFALLARGIASILFGPIGLRLTGSIWGVLFIFNMFGLAIGLATWAFFTAAGLRLFQDLAPEQLIAMQATAPFNGATIAAASQAAPGA
jgi:hypothetical protein